MPAVDNGLIVPYGSDDQGEPVPERLADGVVAGVADHGVDPFQQGELGDSAARENAVADLRQGARGVDDDCLQAVGPGA
ncbi:hypothetical protein Sliba_79310 [Streptomyces nigrescens]|uniref:Uncharacterized protein n=1 Tax=Streptomyces nigrescens TaxID=1920 RepID=A0A640TV17_STRNI|nr:hypothetical protein Sliba_79310 [Streptomyces libani subsp. libani]GGV96034.1 hypothetical protein GCM10010500_37760 [Streptomyces libani subsp. libani]